MREFSPEGFTRETAEIPQSASEIIGKYAATGDEILLDLLSLGGKEAALGVKLVHDMNKQVASYPETSPEARKALLRRNEEIATGKWERN